MSKAEKLLTRLKSANGQFKWKDLVSVLTLLGFKPIEGDVEGDGSRVSFVSDDLIIKLHRPHPQKEMKVYAVRQVKEFLKNEGLL